MYILIIPAILLLALFVMMTQPHSWVRKVLVGLMVSIIALLAVGSMASAHTAEVNPSCTGLEVKVFLYPPEVNVLVNIDGTVVRNTTGGGAWNYDWDQTQNHNWFVIVDSPGTEHDRNFDGSWSACVETTTTAEQTTTTQPEVTTTTTTAPETTSTTTTVVPETTVIVTTVPDIPSMTTVVTGPPSEVAPPQPPAANPPQRAPELPATGPSLGWWLVIMGSLLIALGVLALIIKDHKKPGTHITE